jgi:hypothetical protein
LEDYIDDWWMKTSGRRGLSWTRGSDKLAGRGVGGGDGIGFVLLGDGGLVSHLEVDVISPLGVLHELLGPFVDRPLIFSNQNPMMSGPFRKRVTEVFKPIVEVPRN